MLAFCYLWLICCLLDLRSSGREFAPRWSPKSISSPRIGNIYLPVLLVRWFNSKFCNLFVDLPLSYLNEKLGAVHLKDKMKVASWNSGKKFTVMVRHILYTLGEDICFWASEKVRVSFKQAVTVKASEVFGFLSWFWFSSLIWWMHLIQKSL